MSLETRLITLAQAIGTDVKALNLLTAKQGDLSTLSTTAKTTLVAAINEIVASAGASAAINDTAGDGDTSVTWSADKIFDSIEAAKVAVTNSLINGAAAALDTLNELATALGNDPNFAVTIATEISKRVRFDVDQSLTTPQKTQARANIDATSPADLGSLIGLTVGDSNHDFAGDYAAAKL